MVLNLDKIVKVLKIKKATEASRFFY